MNHRNTPSRTIVFYPDRAKILKGSLPSLYGFLLILPILAYRRSTKRVVKVLSLLMGGLFLLFESIFVPALYSLLFRLPIEELLAQISTQYHDEIQAHGIAIREGQKTTME